MIDPSRPAALDVISRMFLFAPLDAAAQRRIAAAATPHDFPARTKIFEDGAPCDALWLVGSGAVKLYLTGPAGQVQIIGVHGPGAPLQLVAAVDGSPFGATAESLDPVRLFRLPRAALSGLWARDPGLQRHVVALLCRDLRRREVSIGIAGLKNARERIACTLIRWALADHRGGANGWAIPFPLTRQDLAASVGVALETAIRHLSPLERRGVLRTSSRIIEIADLPALRQVARCRECTFPCALFTAPDRPLPPPP